MEALNLGRYYGAAWIVFLIVWAAAAFATKRTERIQSFSSRLGEGVIIWIGAALMIRPNWRIGFLTAPIVTESLAVGVAGLALTVAGLLFAIWARAHLGRNWSSRVTIKQNHELIRSGPYRFVRHPIYTGVCAALAGSVLGSDEVHALLGFVLIAAGLLHKAGIEETFMCEQFGEEYARYQGEVKSMIPFVW